MNFNVKKAKIYEAIKLEADPAFKFSRILKKISFWLFLFSLIFFVFAFQTESLPLIYQRKILGFAFIFLTLWLFCWYQEYFFNLKLKKPRLKIKIAQALDNPKRYNLAEFLSIETAKVFLKSRKNTTEVFYHLVSECSDLNFIFTRIGLSQSYLEQLIKEALKTFLKKEDKENFEKLVIESLKIAQKNNHQRVTPGDLLFALANYDPLFYQILVKLNLTREDIENLILVYEHLKEKIEQRKKFWEWNNLTRWGSIGKDWAAGFTVTLDRFSIDLTRVVRSKGYPDFVGREKEIEKMERVLSRKESKNDILIIGEKGSGRKSLVLALAGKSDRGESLPEVNYKRFVLLNVSALTARIPDPGQVELVLDEIFREIIAAKNVILVIDKFHNYVGVTAGPGIINITGILSSYIHLPQVQIIAISTFEGFHRYIELNPSLLGFFEKITVSELSQDQTLILLTKLALSLERKYKKIISYLALKDIIKFSAKYLPAIPFPEKAIDLLEEAIVYLNQTDEKVLLSRHVAKVVREKTKIPVGKIEREERDILLNLEKLMHQRVINQEKAVEVICSALRRARTEIRVRKGPIGTFLFLGPTGVGKTQTARALAEIYFGSEKRIIRLDMSEFQEIKDIPRVIGSSQFKGLLTTPVRENPFSLVLLDEFEKAHPNLLNLFLQVFDEGHITDGLGRKVNFKNTIIICTSNAGYNLIFEWVKKNKPWDNIQRELVDFLIEKRIFRPELLNRFDAIVAFKPLSRKELLKIAELLLKKVQIILKEKEIEFVITPPLVEKIAELGFSPEFGARPMERVIQKKIGNVLAQAILKGTIRRGERFEINENFEIVKKYSE